MGAEKKPKTGEEPKDLPQEPGLRPEIEPDYNPERDLPKPEDLISPYSEPGLPKDSGRRDRDRRK